MKRKTEERKKRIIQGGFAPLLITPCLMALLALLSRWVSANRIIDQHLIAYSMGFLVAVLVGHWAAMSVVKNMWTYLRLRHPHEAKVTLKRIEGKGQSSG